MPTYSKQLLTGSTNGKQIKISASATPGTLIHTAVSGCAALDEIWLYAVNSDVSAAKLTIEWGEATVPNGNIEVSIPGEGGYVLVVPGLLLQNSCVIGAFASTGSIVLLNGFVNRIT